MIVNMIKSRRPLDLASSIPALHRPAPPPSMHYNVQCMLFITFNELYGYTVERRDVLGSTTSKRFSKDGVT